MFEHPIRHGLPARLRRFNCCGCALLLVLAWIGLAALFLITDNSGGSLSSRALTLATMILAFAIVALILRAVTTQRIWLCPHCGVRTRPGFRVCSSCGRAKRPS